MVVAAGGGGGGGAWAGIAWCALAAAWAVPWCVVLVRRARRGRARCSLRPGGERKHPPPPPAARPAPPPGRGRERGRAVRIQAARQPVTLGGGGGMGEECSERTHSGGSCYSTTVLQGSRSTLYIILRTRYHH